MGAFKLGNMTFGSLFKKPETVLYPIQTKPQPAGLKGHIAIDVDNCILCGMCDRSCATDCITVSKADAYWEIDRYQCIQCGYCVTVCPKKCLHMDPDYAPASTERKPDRFDVPTGDAPAKKAGAKEEKPVEAAPAAEEAASAGSAQPADEVLEAKIGLMDEAKAEKVRAALAGAK